MNTIKLPRLMIAGTGSGCGKTTITCAVLKALVNRKLNPTSFKCGPDYIDPMFHSKVLGIKSRNLDLFMCGEQTLRYLFAHNGQDGDIAVIEGVMGLYDGLGGSSSDASSNHLSVVTDTPTVLVVNCKGMSLSVAAVVKGYLDFMPNKISGILLNGTTKMMYSIYKELIEMHTGIRVYGYMPYLAQAGLESRHLGLITADEVEQINQKLDLLAQQAEQSIDLDGLLWLANQASDFTYEPIQFNPISNVTIAVAMDRAFCFYYQDNLALFEQLGAKLVYFSPIYDQQLPNDIDGLYLGGGYPELYAQQLSENKTMLYSVQRAVQSGIPTIAECGGFIYLQKSIVVEQNTYELAGVVDAHTHMTDQLTRFGYVTLTAHKDNLLCRAGEQINGHEFHYADSSENGECFHAQKPLRNRSWQCIVGTSNLFAGYPHLHFWGNPSFSQRFVEQCAAYQVGRKLL